MVLRGATKAETAGIVGQLGTPNGSHGCVVGNQSDVLYSRIFFSHAPMAPILVASAVWFIGV